MSIAAILVVAALQGAKVQSIINLSTAPTPVQLPVVLRTLFGVVGLLIRALLHFEHFEVQVLPPRTISVE